MKTRKGNKRNMETGQRERGNEQGNYGRKIEFKPPMGEDILRELQRMNNEHMAKMEQMFKIEKSKMRKELYDILLIALKSGSMSYAETPATLPHTADGNSNLGNLVERRCDVDINDLLSSIRAACINEEKGNHSDLGVDNNDIGNTRGEEMGEEANLETRQPTSNPGNEEEIGCVGKSGSEEMAEDVSLNTRQPTNIVGNDEVNNEEKIADSDKETDWSKERDQTSGKHGELTEGNRVGETSEVEESGTEKEMSPNIKETKAVASISHDGDIQNKVCVSQGHIEGEEEHASNGEGEKSGNTGKEVQAIDDDKERNNDTYAKAENAKIEASEMDRKRGRGQEGIKNVYIRQRRSKRARKNPNRFGFCDSPKQEINSQIGQEHIYDPLGYVPVERKKKFLATLASQRHRQYTVNAQPVRGTFFKQIYKPTSHVNSQHMEAMLSLVWKKIGGSLLEKRVGILDTWFAHVMSNEHGRFLNAKRKDTFAWNTLIKNYVKGNVASRSGEMAWIKDLDVVYAPMNWGGSTLGCASD